LVLLLIGIAIGAFLYIRKRRQSKRSWLPSGEEHIPLSRSLGEDDVQNDGLNGDSKGKGRAPGETIFDVGSDDEEEYRDHAK
jgi:hypothetical protein